MTEQSERDASLAADMRAIDASLAEVPLPEGLEARILAASTIRTVGGGPVGSREFGGRAGRRRAVGLALAFAAGVLLTLAWVGGRDEPSSMGADAAVQVDAPADEVVREPPAPAPSELPSPMPGFELLAPECAWSRTEEGLALASGCRLRVAEPTMELEVWAPTQLRPIPAGVAVDEGVVLFAVEHRSDPASPAKVGVSGGMIEILGTRFVVEQREAGGHVDLLTGEIRFRGLDGAVDHVEPGQRYRWQRSREPAPADASSLPTPKPTAPEAPAAKDELAQILAEVARLRRSGDDTAAIAKLDALAQREQDTRTLEVISYERGTLIERSATPADACAAWAAHGERFPGGRYAAEIARRLERLGCASE